MAVNRREYDQVLEAELIELEVKAETVRVPGADAPFFNAAGDLCASAYEDVRALEYYGRAVDAYLKAERWESAAAMCRKILRAAPHSVRARCTLSWLAIGKGFVADAQTQVTDYAETAYREGRAELAAHQITRMGEITPNSPLRITLAEQLLTLGADKQADHLFGLVFHEENFGRTRTGDLDWGLIRRAAMMGPRELTLPPPGKSPHHR